MTFIDSVILGIVEGITEFLPISSTAHLMMASKILGFEQSTFVKSFEIVIQFGAIAAVLVLFGTRLYSDKTVWKKVAIAFAPTAVVGFVLYKVIKGYLIGNLSIMVWTLILGGLVLIAVEYFYFKKPFLDQQDASANSKNSSKETLGTGRSHTITQISEFSNLQAFSIGLIQSLSVIPGVSRAAATIIPAIFFGASRKVAAEFSFFLAIPTVAAAAGYDLIKNLHVVSFSDNLTLLITGFIVSFVAAIIGIKFMMSFISKNSLTSFGIYRIIVAIIFFFIFVN